MFHKQGWNSIRTTSTAVMKTGTGSMSRCTSMRHGRSSCFWTHSHALKSPQLQLHHLLIPTRTWHVTLKKKKKNPGASGVHFSSCAPVFCIQTNENATWKLGGNFWLGNSHKQKTCWRVVGCLCWAGRNRHQDLKRSNWLRNKPNDRIQGRLCGGGEASLSLIPFVWVPMKSVIETVWENQDPLHLSTEFMWWANIWWPNQNQWL